MPKTLYALALLLIAPSLALGQAPKPYILGPTGTYTIQTGGSTKIEYGDGWIFVSWVADPAPNPDPTPDPKPAPPAPPQPPAPVATGKLYVTLIYDMATDDQAKATMRADLATSTAWAGLDVVFRAYEKTQKALDDLNLRGAMASTALPCVIIQELKAGATTAPVVKTEVAVSQEAVLATVKQLRGIAK